MKTDWLIIGIYGALFLVIVGGLLAVYIVGGFG